MWTSIEQTYQRQIVGLSFQDPLGSVLGLSWPLSDILSGLVGLGGTPTMIWGHIVPPGDSKDIGILGAAREVQQVGQGWILEKTDWVVTSSLERG